MKLISKPLFKQTLKSNWKLWAAITGVMALLLIMITGVMGSVITKRLADNPGMAGMMGANNPMAVASNMFYGQMAVMIILVYVIITANALVASQVDKGSMSYTLSTPIKRTTVTMTQMIYLLGSLLASSLVLIVSHVLGSLIGGITINFGQIILVNLGLFLLSCAIAGISFMASCIFNLSKNSLLIGAGVPVLFYVFSMVAQMGEPSVPGMDGIPALANFKYVTIMSLFNTSDIAAKSSNIIWSFIALALIAIVTFTIGHLIFKKKDLPL
ncbi:MAG: ABC transporter permease [Acholeplasmatales bacterium]|jgi:ABC-2 type transport system permease protein|nr:ABC transporter permease [Acholeplasmatales bacterium]